MLHYLKLRCYFFRDIKNKKRKYSSAKIKNKKKEKKDSLAFHCRLHCVVYSETLSSFILLDNIFKLPLGYLSLWKATIDFFYMSNNNIKACGTETKAKNLLAMVLIFFKGIQLNLTTKYFIENDGCSDKSQDLNKILLFQWPNQ
jgi:hypothetical protein